MLAIILFSGSLPAQELEESLLSGLASKGAEKAREFSRQAPELINDFIGTEKREFETEKECLSELQLFSNAGVLVSNTMPFSNIWIYETSDGPITRARILFNGEKVHTEVFCDGSDLIAKTLDWHAKVPEHPAYNNGTLNAALGALLILNERRDQGSLSESMKDQAPEKESPPSLQAPDGLESFVNDALSNALTGAFESTPSNELDKAPEEETGVPLTSSEKDALRVSIQRCWNIGSLSSEALRTTVVVNFDIDEQGRPDIGSISLIDTSGYSSTATKHAFEAARRAIIRCGNAGFELPPEKANALQNVRVTFDPEGMVIH
jgi:hypothetical protein